MSTSLDVAEAQHRWVLELIEDRGEDAYWDIRETFYPASTPERITLLIDDVTTALAHFDASACTYSSPAEIARERRWGAEDAVAAFLREVA